MLRKDTTSWPTDGHSPVQSTDGSPGRSNTPLGAALSPAVGEDIPSLWTTPCSALPRAVSVHVLSGCREKRLRARDSPGWGMIIAIG